MHDGGVVHHLHEGAQRDEQLTSLYSHSVMGIMRQVSCTHIVFLTDISPKGALIPIHRPVPYMHCHSIHTGVSLSSTNLVQDSTKQRVT